MQRVLWWVLGKPVCKKLAGRLGRAVLGGVLGEPVCKNFAGGLVQGAHRVLAGSWQEIFGGGLVGKTVEGQGAVAKGVQILEGGLVGKTVEGSGAVAKGVLMT